jgi:hypothetical protein
MSQNTPTMLTGLQDQAYGAFLNRDESRYNAALNAATAQDAARQQAERLPSASRGDRGGQRGERQRRAALGLVVGDHRHRLAGEQRRGQLPTPADGGNALLLVIDADTAAQPHWQGLEPERLDQAGIYRLWRVDRRRLELRAAHLRHQGFQPNWREPRPERY